MVEPYATHLPYDDGRRILNSLILFLRGAGYEFVTPTPATHDRVNSRPGRREATLLTDVFGWSRPFGRALLPSALFETLRDSGVVREFGRRLEEHSACVDVAG